MTTTPRLGITQLEEGQALPEAVVNEGFVKVELGASRFVVLSKGDNAPAGGESDGQGYLVGSSGTGAFLGHDDELAFLENGAWEFYTPLDGWEIEVLDEDTSYTYRGGTWVDTGGASFALDDLTDVNAPTPSDGQVLTWDSTPGEWVPATPASVAASALVLITETVTSSSATNVSFTSIANTYRDLEIRVRGRGTKAATSVAVRLRFNGDTGSNYDWVDYEAKSPTSGNVSGEGVGVAFIVMGYLAGSTAPANASDLICAEVGDYGGTTFQKSMVARSNLKTAASTGNLWNMVSSGWWRSTSAITQIDIFPDSNAFVDGTVVSLYGRL